MSNNKKIITFAGLIVLLTFSCLMFLGLDFGEKKGVEICSFIFVLITEIIIFANVFILSSKKFNTFLVAGLSSFCFLYSIASLMFNILFVWLFKSIRGVLVLNLSLLLIYAFLIIILLLFRREEK